MWNLSKWSWTTSVSIPTLNTVAVLSLSVSTSKQPIGFSYFILQSVTHPFTLCFAQSVRLTELFFTQTIICLPCECAEHCDSYLGQLREGLKSALGSSELFEGRNTKHTFVSSINTRCSTSTRMQHSWWNRPAAATSVKITCSHILIYVWISFTGTECRSQTRKRTWLNNLSADVDVFM